jgi:hypothetical protein
MSINARAPMSSAPDEPYKLGGILSAIPNHRFLIRPPGRSYHQLSVFAKPDMRFIETKSTY